MSRFFASSVTADILGRAWNLFLFILLLPAVLILTRLPQVKREESVGQTWPRSARPSAPKQ
jgi:hypothetical protein